MTSYIKSSRGSTELLLVVPLFVLLAWGSAMVLAMLHQSGRLERAGWVYSTTLSHSIKKADAAQKDAKTVFAKVRNPGVSFPDVGRNWQDYLYPASNLKFTKALGSKIDLPKTFLLFLLIKGRERKKIESAYSLDAGILSYLAARQFRGIGSLDLHGSSRRTQNIELEVPGHSFKDKWDLDFAIELESTKKTSYRCIPFIFWGGKEIAHALELAANIDHGPVSTLAEGVEEAIAQLCPF